MAPGRRDGAGPARHLRTGRAGQGHAAPFGLALPARRGWLPRSGGGPPTPCRPGHGRRRRPAGGSRRRGHPRRDRCAPGLGRPGSGRRRSGRRAHRHLAVARQAIRDCPRRRRRRCGWARLAGPGSRRPRGHDRRRRPSGRRGRLGHRHPARSRARVGAGGRAPGGGRLAACPRRVGAAEHDLAAGVEEAAPGPAPDRRRRRGPGARRWPPTGSRPGWSVAGSGPP